MAEKKVFDYKKITKEEIAAFMVDNATKQEKADFYKAAFIPTPKTVLMPVLVNGEPQYKITKDGKKVAKRKQVAVEGSALEEKYSHRAAVAWFCDYYESKGAITVINRPVKSEKPVAPTAKDLFADFK